MLRRVFLLATLIFVLCAGTALAESKKVITVASDCNWPPMEFLGDNKKPVGFSVDLLAEMSKELGVTFDIKNIAWDGIFSGVAAGKYDMVSSSVTVTEERKKVYLFSDSYYDVTQAVVMPKGKSIASLNDLRGQKVGGQIGTTGIFVMDKAKTGAVVKEYEDVGLAMEDLRNGRLDAVICDSNVATYYANKKVGFENKFHVAFKTKEVENLAFCLQKGSEDLVKLLNEGLAKVRASGKYDELVRKWMGD